MLDNSGFVLVLTRLHQKGHCNMEYFLHLCQHEGYFMLQKSAALVKIFGKQSLTDCAAGLFCVELSQSEHGTVPLEEAIVGIVEQYLRQVRHICIGLILLVVEGWCRVIRSELQLLHVDALRASAISLLIPLDQVLCQFARFKDHFTDLTVRMATSVPLQQTQRVLI